MAQVVLFFVSSQQYEQIEQVYLRKFNDMVQVISRLSLE